MDTETLSNTLLGACSKILRPLIKILLRHGVGFNAFSDLAKSLYIDVARTEYAIPGKKQTASRISTMTGLSRKEVSRVSQLPDFESSLDSAQINRAARVVSGWARDKNFHDENGEPLDLAFDDDGPNFTALVKQYSGDITARTIADELMRVGAISVTPQGKIRLAQRAYIPKDDEVQNLNLLGTDVSDLVRTMDHNMIFPEQPYFQRKVCYTAIDPRCMDELRLVLGRQAQTSLETMQQHILANSRRSDTSRSYRVGVGIYYFEQEENS